MQQTLLQRRSLLSPGYTNRIEESPGLFAHIPFDTYTFVPRPFSSIADLKEPVDAIVFDLGISSMQIDVAERGFSFRADAALDMRMEQNGMTAADFIKKSTVAELADVLRNYGDVKKSNVLARVIPMLPTIPPRVSMAL